MRKWVNTNLLFGDLKWLHVATDGCKLITQLHDLSACGEAMENENIDKYDENSLIATISLLFMHATVFVKILI